MPCHPLVGGDRRLEGLHARLQIADLQQRASVIGILLDELVVLGNRPVEALLFDELLGSLEDLFAVDGHGFVDSGANRARLPHATRSFMEIYGFLRGSVKESAGQVAQSDAVGQLGPTTRSTGAKQVNA